MIKAINEADRIVKVNDDVECALMHNGWDYSEEAKHVVFGDGKGIDIYLCTQEPFEGNDGRTCISAYWEPPCDVDDLISSDQYETLSQLIRETGCTIDADDGTGDIRDGAWEEVVKEAKTESYKRFEEINSAA